MRELTPALKLRCNYFLLLLCVLCLFLLFISLIWHYALPSCRLDFLYSISLIGRYAPPSRASFFFRKALYFYISSIVHGPPPIANLISSRRLIVFPYFSFQKKKKKVVFVALPVRESIRRRLGWQMSRQALYFGYPLSRVISHPGQSLDGQLFTVMVVLALRPPQVAMMRT